MKKEFNAGNLLEPILGEVVSQWMLDILDQLEDQVNTISPDDYEEYHDYTDVVDRVTDFSNDLLFHQKEKTTSENLGILFDDIQEAMNEFAMLDEIGDLENRIFSEIARVIKEEDIEVVKEPETSFKAAIQGITNCYLDRLYSGVRDRFTNLVICI